MKSYLLMLLLLACVMPAKADNVAARPTEQDYFIDVPLVLSVTRLAQPLDETPGAVTVIDRETIRRSGAREIAEVLRLVPGFLVTSINGANPLAVYHGDFDSLNRRLQVFVDGRSIYSAMFTGNVHHGMMGLVLEDIERIEVLRGSNSAAYGANAMIGVINIVTRHAADSRGVLASVTGGSQGISDQMARVGWGDERAAFRLTAARRSDMGLADMHDDKLVEQLHLRGDLKLSAQDDLLLSAGWARHAWGAGHVSDPGDPVRTESWQDFYAHAQWRRHLAADEMLGVTASFDSERYDNLYPLPPLSADGSSRRYSLEAQHSFAPAANLRLVWGGAYRHEDVRSPALLYRSDSLSAELWRLFANVEWRPHPQWLINAGGLWEHHSATGGQFAPRLMANYHVLPDHTLRFGRSTAHRTPSLFELNADWRYNGRTYVKATGGAQPERLDANEIGYLGEFRKLGLNIDVRVFEEKMDSLLRYYGANPNDVINKDPNRRRGWETQWRWQPRAGSQFIFSHMHIAIDAEKESDRLAAPRHASTLAWFQKLPDDMQLSVLYHDIGSMTWIRVSDTLKAQRRLDLRLAKNLRLGDLRSEIALTVQAANGRHEEFTPDQFFERRAFLTLRFEY